REASEHAPKKTPRSVGRSRQTGERCGLEPPLKPWHELQPLLNALARALAVLLPAAAAAEPLTLVNIASDGASGQHTCTVVADSLVQRDPLVEKSIKRFVILEEPSAHAPPTPKQVLAEVTRLLNDAKSAYNKGAVDNAVEALTEAQAMLLATEPLPEAFTTMSELQ